MFQRFEPDLKKVTSYEPEKSNKKQKATTLTSFGPIRESFSNFKTFKRYSEDEADDILKMIAKYTKAGKSKSKLKTEVDKFTTSHN